MAQVETLKPRQLGYRSSFAFCAAIGLMLPNSIIANDANSIAQLENRAKALLQERCGCCHSKPPGKSGFHQVLNVREMIRNGYVKPGSAEDSKIFQKIKNDEMPEEGPKLSKDEKETIATWINKLPPIAVKGSFSANEYILDAINKDVVEQAKRDPRSVVFKRYLTLRHLKLDGATAGEMETYHVAATILVNSLSWQPDIAAPEAIDPERTVYRIDLRNYGWDDKTWQAIIDAYPFRVKFGNAACYQALNHDVPFVRMDWFVATASRSPLYNTILRLPPTDLLLEQLLLRTDVLENLAKDDVVRVGFTRSGIAVAPGRSRLIERHATAYGYYWKSYDFKDDSDDLRANPLGPLSLKTFFRNVPNRQREVKQAFGDSKKLFQHAGGELIFSLPNRLQGYMLVNDAGRSLNKAPTNIVADSRELNLRGAEIENAVSCMRCHTSGVIPKDGSVRRHVLDNPNEFQNEYDRVRAIYPDNHQLSKVFKADKERFLSAANEILTKVVEGKTAAQSDLTKVRFADYESAVYVLTARYEEPVCFDLLAAELSLRPTQLKQAIQNSPHLRLLLPDTEIARQKFEAKFKDVVDELPKAFPDSEFKIAQFLPVAPTKQ